jgi:hypothetical protein
MANVEIMTNAARASRADDSESFRDSQTLADCRFLHLKLARRPTRSPLLAQLFLLSRKSHFRGACILFQKNPLL